jgi:hypothetical protein
MIPYSQHPFPLSGGVAFAGSRHGSLFPVAPVVSAVLSSGGSVRVGCAAGPGSLRSSRMSGRSSSMYARAGSGSPLTVALLKMVGSAAGIDSSWGIPTRPTEPLGRAMLRLSTIDHPLGAFGAPGPLHCDLRGGAFDLPEIIWGELDVDSAEVLL